MTVEVDIADADAPGETPPETALEAALYPKTAIMQRAMAALEEIDLLPRRANTMSAALTRFDPPPADHAARQGGRSGQSQGRALDKAGDKAGEKGGGTDAWRGPGGDRRPNGRGARVRVKGRREAGAAGLDQASARPDDAAVMARMADLAAQAGRAIADFAATADGQAGARPTRDIAAKGRRGRARAPRAGG